MFTRLFIYRLRILLKNKTLLFWTFAFPLILGLLFSLAFGNLDQMGKLQPSTVGIVSTDEEQTAQFEEVLKEIKQEETIIYQSQRMTKKAAQQQLASNQISGYFKITNQEIDLFVSKNTMQQTVLKELLNQYLQNTSKTDTLLASGSVLPEELEQALTYENFVREADGTGNFDLKSFYFFTLVGMTIMNGFMWGLLNANDQQANQSANGIRLCLFPRNKLVISLANMLASFVLFFTQVLLILLFFTLIYQVDFGHHWQYILMICGLGSFAAISLGTLTGNLFTKFTYQQKVSVGNSITLVLSFLAGMMGSQSIKYWVSLHVPLLGKINIVNLISESLYQLYYYQSLKPFYANLVWLIGFSLLFVVANYSFEKRVQYDHL